MGLLREEALPRREPRGVLLAEFSHGGLGVDLEHQNATWRESPTDFPENVDRIVARESIELAKDQQGGLKVAAELPFSEILEFNTYAQMLMGCPLKSCPSPGHLFELRKGRQLIKVRSETPALTYPTLLPGGGAPRK